MPQTVALNIKLLFRLSVGRLSAKSWGFQMSGGTIWTFATAALGILGTLGGVFGGHWMGLRKDRKLRQDELDRHAYYLAIRVVCSLDPFVTGCCEVVNDDGMTDQDGEVVARVEYPNLMLPADVEWKSINAKLMYRIIGFQNEIDGAGQSISFWAQESGPPNYDEYFEERILQYGKLGLAALALADELRQIYGIPARDFGNWDPKSILKEATGKITKEREDARARQAEFMSSLASNAHAVPVSNSAGLSQTRD